MNKKNIIVAGLVSVLLTTSSFAFGSAPTITKLDINNGDILTKDILNTLQDNVNKIYNWIKWGFEVDGSIMLKDVNKNKDLWIS